ncbi:hypothetical protein GMB51_13945 [Turicibacter sanguinis]|nr:hypothetical protein [Turicibacter sanguinis]MTN52054.1 hypothetical protein [Turicibacter sanguinis]MTN55112.1 hypothetical protein [Turicibacter sanguinis]MTN58319.1 hypothetical protein [Turicibacter sanguinis]MTN61409.1 hypothetical protein [Turicibacter sanguinis]
MYVVSDKFKSAIESTSRSMSCKAYLRGIELSVDKILKLDIEDNINNGDYFTIGEVPSRSLTIEMIGVQGLVEGDEIKPYYGVEVSPGKFEYVPCGVFYVDSLTINKDKISATCYDKMLSLEEEYTPNIAIPVTLTEIMNDICQQKGIEFEGELPNITLSKSIKGYSYREMIGFIASFCGGNAKFNRLGKLVIQQYAQTGKIVNPDVCASFEHKDVYTVSAIACKFGDVANTRGDSSANCVNFTNPYVDDSNIDSIFNLLNGLTFTAANFKYKGDPSVDSGDLITINDVKGNSHVVLVSTQDFKFSGGLTSEITSIGEGKGANAYKQYKFKNKKSITELNVELGLIQGIISEVQEKQEDTYTKTETETLIEAKAGEISLSVAKKEIDIARGEITDKIAQININVDSITNEVSSIKDSSFGGNNLVTNGNFSNGTSHWEATKYNGPGIFEFAVFNEDNSNSWCLNNKKIGWCSAEALPIEESVIGEWALCQEFDTVIGQTYTVSYFISGHRSSKSVVIRNGLGTLWDDISEQKWYGHLNGGKADSGWKWDSITFVAQHTKSVVWFRMHGRIAEYDDVNSMYLWIADVCCVEGKMASKWIPNIDEYYSRTEANTLIQQTADGINETLNKTIEISKSEAINQANLTTDNKLQSYPTKTEMNIEIDKRANGIVSTVKKIEKSLVTDNLLMEGDFSNNLHSWRYYDQGYPISCEAQNSSDWIMPAKVALHLNASYHPAGVDSGITQTFYTKWYTNYTITGYIASHRAEGMVILKDDAGNWLTFDKTNPDQEDYTGGSDIARWRRVKFTYYSGERGQMQLCLALAKSNENGHVWFHDFMITEGDDELCWKPSVRETRTQISQLNDKIETKASIDNMWSYIQQNPYAVMTAINNGRGINGISIDENGLSVFRNNIISMMLNDGKTQLYNPYSGTYMGYFGTEDNDLRVQLTGASTFSVRGGYNDVRMLDLDFNHGHAYGNSTMRICGDVLFQHRDDPNATGVNGLGLGNDDRADMYGHHNIFLLCHNSFGIADNNGYTNMFADARRGRWIMKGGLYQNTESPPSAYILSIDEEHPFFCGKTKMNIVDSILNLETTIKVDNEDDLTMMILPNDDDLVMTDIGNQKHIDQSSIIAGLVETVKLLNNRMLELESELNKRGR